MAAGQPSPPVLQLQQRLEVIADAKTKDWYEDYMLHVIPYRGVKMPELRKELKAWMNRLCLNGSVSATQKKELAQELMQSTFAEDKFAAMLIYQEFLIAGGHCGLADLSVFADWFDQKLLYDWSTCDWLCVKVIGPVAVGAGKEGVDAVAGWKDAANMWRRRAACVSFVNFAKLGDANFPGFIDTLLAVCDITVQTDEKWIQSGTGWVLREVSTASQDALEKVQRFVEGHLAHFSREGLDKALEKMPNATKKRMLAAHEIIKSGGGTLEGVTALKAAEEAASKNRRRAAAATKSKALRARKQPGGVPGEADAEAATGTATTTEAAPATSAAEVDRMAAASAVVPVAVSIPPSAVSAVVPVVIAIPVEEPANETQVPADAVAVPATASAAVAGAAAEPPAAAPVASATPAAAPGAEPAEAGAGAAVTGAVQAEAVPMAVEVAAAAAAEPPASDVAATGKAEPGPAAGVKAEGATDAAPAAAAMATATAVESAESNKKPRLDSADA
eukprot:jgi/Mesvir1/28317/Mv04837-RA.1